MTSRNGAPMKIAASDLNLQAAHSFSYRERTQVSLQAWSNNAGTQRPPSAPSTTSHLSDAGRSLSSKDAASVDNGDSDVQDPFLRLVKQVVEIITGKPVKVFSAAAWHFSAQGSAHQQNVSEVQQTSQSGGGARYDYRQLHSESESTQVDATGTVTTADGQTLQLNLHLSMDRSFTEETHTSVNVGSPVRTDPLVLNFQGTAAQLIDQFFQFDLNNDGKEEKMPQLARGSGYLAFDRNGNGRIDNGSELFGPATGSGFAELAALDKDHNGWIDENDPAFSRLTIWTPQSGTTGALQPLASQNVGALYLGNVSSPFSLRNRNNVDLGTIAATGLYLRNDGSPGTLQEVDITG